MTASSQEYISVEWGAVASATRPVIPRPIEPVLTTIPVIFSQQYSYSEMVDSALRR
jgi:hypothetical protein